MSIIAPELHARLLDGLPPRVRGMAEAIIVEWERAVVAVPELERLAAEDVDCLASLDPEEREQALRRRWGRLNDVPAFELRGRAMPQHAGGRVAAAR